VGQHGSWNRNSFSGYKVVYIPFENGAPSGKARDVVTDFLDGEQARGRPVGLGIDGTGALLVADDAGNKVWRVAAADGTLTPEPVGTDQITVGVAGGRGQRATGEQEATSSSDSSSDAARPNPPQMNIAPAVLPAGPNSGMPEKQGQ
jgi:hypothetical protein